MQSAVSPDHSQSMDTPKHGLPVLLRVFGSGKTTLLNHILTNGGLEDSCSGQ